MILDLTVEVDKRIPLDAFKKHLESYVGVHSLYFNCFQNSTRSKHGVFSSDEMIASLRNLEFDSTLHVRLGYPPKSGSLRGRLHFQPCNSVDVSVRDRVFFLPYFVTRRKHFP